MSTKHADEISLTQVWDEVFKKKLIIIITGSIFCIVSVIIAIKLPNLYTAKVLTVANQDEQGDLGSLAKNLGGLASIAGINVGKSQGPDKAAIALEVIKSQRFINDFVFNHNLVIPLMAAKSSEPITYKLIIDEDIYDEKNDKWLREPEPPRSNAPSPQEIYEAFLEIMEVNKDPKSGFISISIEFYSPHMSVRWLNLLLKDINEELRNEDKNEAKTSIDYLQKAIGQTKNINMHETFYQLIEEQTKVLMLAESREEYVFKTIAPAVVPEK
uniref:Wzz/FepE/Etk N-terminal domain-containing protein n=1 Tax=uncultured Paraglaciecola sp. TaxID=1765024 RepID=UPI0025CBCEF6